MTTPIEDDGLRALAAKIVAAAAKYIRAEDTHARKSKRDPLSTSRDAADAAAAMLLDFDPRDCDVIVRALRSSPAVDGVGVKALVWHYYDRKHDYGKGQWEAYYDGRAYTILDVGPGGSMGLQFYLQGYSQFVTLDEAKAAAQSDHDRRIRSALSPTSSDRASVDAASVLRELARNETNEADAKALRYAANRLNSFDALKAEAALSPRSS